KNRLPSSPSTSTLTTSLSPKTNSSPSTPPAPTSPSPTTISPLSPPFSPSTASKKLMASSPTSASPPRKSTTPRAVSPTKSPGPLASQPPPPPAHPASAPPARLSEKDLAAAFLELGDETDAPKIARAIVERRAEKPITTTQDLMAIVCHARDFTLTRAAGAKL